MCYFLGALLVLADFLCLADYKLGSGGQNQQNSGTVSSQSPPKLLPSQIFSSAKPSVVVIIASSRDNEEALGSGFIVGHNRIVTNHHVVMGKSQAFVVFSDGKVQSVSEVVSDSAQRDLIILGADTGERRSLLLGDELSLREGDTVYAIGAPKGFELSFTNGIVSSFRQLSSQFLIQATAPIAPGSSGGPLLNDSGHVVGVTTSGVTDAPGVYFSVGVGDVKRLLRTPYTVALTLETWAAEQTKANVDSQPGRNHPAQAGEPSLDATSAWMSDFSTQHGKHKGVSGDQYFDTFQKDEGCSATITHSVRAVDSSSVAVDKFSLADLDKTSILASSVSDTITVFTQKQFLLIHRTGATRVFELNSDYLSFDSKDSADRFAVALAHAITVCQTTKEVF